MYLTVKKASQKWNISEDEILNLIKNNSIIKTTRWKAKPKNIRRIFN
ncbi:hypothetical protein [Mycoplasma mycoides]|nr:hypothetical protein [Mycoplasma mycoides]